MRMRIHHKIIVFSVLILTLSIAFSPQSAEASEKTYPVDAGSNIVQFRDIDFLDSTPNATINLDDIFQNKGGTGTCSISDFNKNLDVAVIDSFNNVTIVQPSSETTITATETEINKRSNGGFDIFNGTFLVTDNFVPQSQSTERVTICSHNQDSPQAARAKVTLPLSIGGEVIISDSSSIPSLTNIRVNATTLPLNVTLTNGASFSETPTIVLSFANTDYPEENDDPDIGFGSGLEMWHKAPGQEWEKITDSCKTRAAVPAHAGGPLDCSLYDFHAKTITSNSSSPGFSGTDGQGLYALGINTEAGGGGGGGLVRPSLVVNALAGIGGGAGGGSAYSSPQLQVCHFVQLGWLDVPLEVEQTCDEHDSSNPATAYDLGYFEDFDYPLVINDKGFILSGFTTTLETQSLKTNTPHTIKFIVYESEIIQHLSLYTNLRDATDEIHESDTQILYNANQELQVVDPNGFFESVSLTVNELDDNKKEVVLELTFAKTMDTSHIIVRSWDPNLYSGDTYILDAWEIVSDVVVEPPTPTYVEPEIQELKSETIPIWIKNNAAWWAEQQIGDSDFVSGIEYLITNGIINVPGVEVGTTATTEIPDWIKNNAAWWAESLITDEDFIEAMQWLVANGVIQI